MTCNVCIEPYTLMQRKCITCPYCEYHACSRCVSTYILERPDSPNCMNCNKAWGRIFLSKQFTRKFLNVDYKIAKANILFELEKSLMPDTQRYVEIEKENMNHRVRICANTKRIRDIYKVLRSFYVVDRVTKESEYSMKVEVTTLKLENDLLQWYIINPSVVGGNENEKSMRKFTKSCCRDGCRGFLSTQWKCGVCEKYMCSKCHEAKDDEHTCNPDTVKTIESLKTSEYRQCPKCSAMIYKIDGCNQMFCVSSTCRTAFDWRTGKVITGRIHNPHYFEYMRERGDNGREIGDIQCGGLPAVWDVSHHLNTRYKRGAWPVDVGKFYNFLRILVEFSDVHARPLQEVNVFDLNLKERVRYMMNEIDDTTFKMVIQQRNKDLEKKRELGMVSTTVIQIMTDIYSRYMTEDINTLISEIKEACVYTNHLYADVSEAYGCVAPYIDFDECRIGRIMY